MKDDAEQKNRRDALIAKAEQQVYKRWSRQIERYSMEVNLILKVLKDNEPINQVSIINGCVNAGVTAHRARYVITQLDGLCWAGIHWAHAKKPWLHKNAGPVTYTLTDIGLIYYGTKL